MGGGKKQGKKGNNGRVSSQNIPLQQLWFRKYINVLHSHKGNLHLQKPPPKILKININKETQL